MEMIGKKVVNLMVVISTVIVVVSGLMQEAHGELDICRMPISSFIPCMPSVVQPNPPAPAPKCCETIKQIDEKCLCAYVRDPLMPSYGMDKTLLLSLPG